MITNTDRDGFLWLWKVGYTTASQYSTLFYNSATGLKVARRRLNILVQEKYLNFFLSGNRDHIFYLNKDRIDTVRNLLGDDVENIIPETSKPQDLRFIAHHLAINDCIMYLHLTCKQNPIYSFSFIPEYRRIESGGKKLEKITSQYIPDLISQRDFLFTPDCVIKITNNKNSRSALYFLEADRGNTVISSSKHNNDIEEKINIYNKYRQLRGFETYSEEFGFNFKGFRVLFVVPSEKRQSNILRYCDSDMTWVTTWDKLSRNTIFNKIWKTRTPTGSELKAIVKGGKNE